MYKIDHNYVELKIAKIDSLIEILIMSIEEELEYSVILYYLKEQSNDLRKAFQIVLKEEIFKKI